MGTYQPKDFDARASRTHDYIYICLTYIYVWSVKKLWSANYISGFVWEACNSLSTIEMHPCFWAQRLPL